MKKSKISLLFLLPLFLMSACVNNQEESSSSSTSSTPTSTSTDSSTSSVPEIINVSSVSLNETSKVMEVGDTFQLIATVLPVDANDKTVRWSTTNESVVTVSNGLITAKAVGTASVSATTVDGGFVASCEIEVKEKTAPSHKVTVNFYLDYNHAQSAKYKYYSCSVMSGNKITDIPATPEAPYEEFPVFKGWATKAIIDDDNDLWDFENDLVLTDSTSMVLYGIWVAEGE